MLFAGFRFNFLPFVILLVLIVVLALKHHIFVADSRIRITQLFSRVPLLYSVVSARMLMMSSFGISFRFWSRLDVSFLLLKLIFLLVN